MANKMLEYVINALKEFDFEVQETSYSALTSTPQLSPLKELNFPNNDAAKLIKYFPDLFALHRHAEPQSSALFIIVTNKTISDNEVEIYKKYFPRELAVFSVDDNNKIFCRWLTMKSVKPLEAFIRDTIRIQE